MREVTERTEVVDADTVKLVGTRIAKIVGETKILLTAFIAYKKMSQEHNPHGNGKASERIVEALKS